MSDNSSSTGSSGSSTNSWTLLSPEEAAVENVGPVDDGTESLGDVPSLSEEVTGAAVEFKSNDNSVETVLSEEGHQVCQETSPGSSEGPILSSLDLNVESQPPVIHDIVTTSHSGDEHVGTTPFVTNIELGAPLNIPDSELLTTQSEESSFAPPPTEDPVSTEQQIDSPDIGLFPAGAAGESPVGTPEVNIPAETIAATDPPSQAEADITRAPDDTEPSQYRESLGAESLTDDSRAPETIGSVEAEEETATEKEEVESQIRDEREDEEEEEEEEPSSSFDFGDASNFDSGLRRRNFPPFDAPRPRTSDEEDEEEDAEFKLAEKKEEEKSWFSLNKCIVGALILLFLGSLFLSGDFDGPEPSDREQSQDWLSGDPQDMKDLLDKLTQENQQITQLEAQLRSEKEQLESTLKEVAASGDEKGTADLEKENANLREELSFLPELKKELESLRARVTELNQLIDNQETPLTTPSPPPQSGEKRVMMDGESTQKAFGPLSKRDKNKEGKLKDELKRQKALLEESGKRLKGMSKDGGDRVRVRDHLAAIQKELSEKVKRWAEKKPQDSKGKGKIKERDHWKKEEKKKWKGEKDKKHSKEEEWRGKEERQKKEQKSQKENSHKEAWRKHQDEWERKKGERKMDREDRRKEKPWHSQSRKHSHSHHGRHHHHHHHHHDQNNFWRDQEQKLRRNIRPQLDCSSLEDCANKEGLYPVELPEFEELLEGYLSKLEGSSSESKDKIRRLTAEFFEDGVFIHTRVRFSDFAEDVADILEDMVDVLEDGGKKKDDSLEEEMEEFEREALWKFAATA